LLIDETVRGGSCGQEKRFILVLIMWSRHRIFVSGSHSGCFTGWASTKDRQQRVQ
jgi:hypothetical protein